MEQKNSPIPQRTLEEVRDQFEHWYQIKKSRCEPIPEKL